MAPALKRVFFDSGLVLVYPVSGDWFLSKAYAEARDRAGLPAKPAGLRARLRAAGRYLDDNHLVTTREAEYGQFVEFYAMLFSGLEGLDRPGLAAELARERVYDTSLCAFYPDVRESVERLGERYRLGVISDAWPSLFSVYEANGMLDRFDPVVVSSMHGVTKGGKRLFDIALDAVDEAPDQCLFVDDCVRNCRIARRKGMRVALMSRSGARRAGWGLDVVHSMADVEALLS